MEPYYFHGFRDYNVDTVLKVLESGFILPRRMLKNGPTDGNNIFNGNSWISLSQKSAADSYMLERFRDSYSEWIVDHLCAVIDPDIEGIAYPSYIPRDEFYSSLRKRLVYDSNPDRYSYYIDEVQTNVAIPTSSFLALGYPVNYFSYKKGDKKVSEDIDKLYKILDEKGLNIPVIDSTDYDFADDCEHIEYSKIKRL